MPEYHDLLQEMFLVPHLAAFLVDLGDGFHSIEVINTRVQTNLVHNYNPRFLCFVIKLFHSRGYITSGDDVGFSPDCGLYHCSVMGVRNQRDYKIMCGDLRVENILQGYIKGDGLSVRKSLSKCFCAAERSAC